MVKESILLIGTADPAPWHPLSGVEGEFRSLLTDLGTLEVTTDAQRLVSLEKEETGLLVCYADTWDDSLNDEQTAGLVRFAAGGGNLLVIHNGISYQKRPEFQALVGAKFMGHPDMTLLPFRSVAPGHPVCQGLAAEWDLKEEPYRFQTHTAVEAEILYEYQHEGAWHPAAWTTHFGLGTVVYLMPGHTAASFQHPAYRELIRSSVRWLLNKIKPLSPTGS